MARRSGRHAALLLIALAVRPCLADEHWAFKPVRQPQVPAIQYEDWPASAIDRFVIARLEAGGLRPAEQAPPALLLRRITFDLAGRPPTIAEQDAFLAAPTKAAWEKAVQRLLASAEFGERWGQHWLDVARFAESSGGGRSLMFPQAWRYRDYVVDALNRDIPFDRFVIEQLAGDHLPAETAEERDRQTIATGFLTLGAINYELQDKQLLEMEIVDEQIDVVGRAFLGMSLGCARCHDHKFDPVAMKEYYGLAGIFTSTQSVVHDNVGRPMMRKLASGEETMAVADHEKPADTYVRYGGDAHDRGPIVPRSFIAIAGTPQDCLPDSRLPVISTGKSGRLELARWIASAENRLTSRVIVNRVWHHLFGRGIVATTDDFGTTGARPTHPELLDYLATTFVADGWSLKSLVRRIATSRVYQLTSEPTEELLAHDPANQLWGRAQRRQLDAEAIRDALLAVSGQLDEARGGPSIHTVATYDTGYQFTSKRRSIYIPRFRNVQPAVREAFGGANANMVTGCRVCSILPTQALFLLNGSDVIEAATRTGEEACQLSSDDRERVEFVYRRALGRRPSAAEAELANRYLHEMRSQLAHGTEDSEALVWSGYCQLVFASLDFRYLN